MAVDKSRVRVTPCITISAGEWYTYPGWEDFLCQEGIATYADQEELRRVRYNRRQDYDKDEYCPDEYQDVFMLVQWNGPPDKGGRPSSFGGDTDTLKRHCPQAWNDLADILVEMEFGYGLIRVVNSEY